MTASCVRLYKAGLACGAATAAEPCCTRGDKEVFASIWSLRNGGARDSLLTASAGERAALVAGGAWVEKCSAIANPTAFCVDGSEPDGRAGPFLLYNASVVEGPQYLGAPPLPTAPLYRCITPAARHFISRAADCEARGAAESVLGYVALSPGVEFVRALRRCRDAATGEWSHALDLPCDAPDPDAPAPLGYVR